MDEEDAKKYYIKQITIMLSKIEDIKLIQYLFYFIKEKIKK